MPRKQTLKRRNTRKRGGVKYQTSVTMATRSSSRSSRKTPKAQALAEELRVKSVKKHEKKVIAKQVHDVNDLFSSMRL